MCNFSYVKLPQGMGCEWDNSWLCEFTRGYSIDGEYSMIMFHCQRVNALIAVDMDLSGEILSLPEGDYNTL